MRGMALRPLEAARKVYIIRGAEDLAEEGANALLKTLEEPPPAVTIILTAPDPAALLPTIVSRCQLLRLHTASAREIADHLVQVWGLGEQRAEEVAAASGGRPGWAVLAAQDQTLAETRDEQALQLVGLLSASRLERIRAADLIAERWSGHADEVRDTLQTWGDVWHDVLMTQSGLKARMRNPRMADLAISVASRLSSADVEEALASTLDVADILERNAHPRLAMETYTLFLPRLSRVDHG
jgi:DNA polymerase III subunit delta'